MPLNAEIAEFEYVYWDVLIGVSATVAALTVRPLNRESTFGFALGYCAHGSSSYWL
jgi:hypothetical protein